MSERSLEFSTAHKEIFDLIRKNIVSLSNEASSFNQNELKKTGNINLKLLYDIMNASKVPPCIKYM